MSRWPSTLFSVSPSTKSSVKNFSTVEDFCLLEYDAVYLLLPLSGCNSSSEKSVYFYQTAQRHIPRGVYFKFTAMRNLFMTVV